LNKSRKDKLLIKKPKGAIKNGKSEMKTGSRQPSKTRIKWKKKKNFGGEFSLGICAKKWGWDHKNKIKSTLTVLLG